MSQTVITKAFEQLKAQQAANGSLVMLDEFVFANVPGLNITDPIDRNESFPDASQIVYRQPVSKTGMVNSNAVVYSVVLGADTGDFDFNWIGLVHKESNTVAMIVHAPLQKKIKTASGQQGNVLTRSFLMEYDGASQQTQIITPADTWQIDFTARLGAVDERIRRENIDTWGPAGFIGDAFLLSSDGGDKYTLKSGVGYVSGLRAVLLASQSLTVSSKPVKVWVDVCWRGTLTSEWQAETKITVADKLNDYSQGDEQHFVFAVAEINADGTVNDLRPMGNETERKLELTGPVKELSELEPEAKKLVWFDGDKTLAKTPVSDFVRELLEQEDGPAIVKLLGLQDLPFIAKYGAPLIGELVEWPHAQMPQEIWPDMTMEFIPYIGQAFDPARWPLLAQLHPDHVLPADMRGEFLRGWDNGRGLDAGRELLSGQTASALAFEAITGNRRVNNFYKNSATETVPDFLARLGWDPASSGGGYSGGVGMVSTASSSNSIHTLSTSDSVGAARPRNVAWNMIVRAK